MIINEIMKNKLQQFKEKMKRSGLKMTSQRLAIYQLLIQTKVHPDVNFIYKKIKELFPMISLSTVYNTLESFKRAGVIIGVDSRDDLKHYDGNSVPHPHIICVSCNRIDDLDNVKSDMIKKTELFISAGTGYKIIDNFINFYGYCPDCRNKI